MKIFFINEEVEIPVFPVCILAALLLLGSMLYVGAGGEASAIKKLTGVELTRWEAFCLTTPIIVKAK
jgi:hypothetical protein